MGRKCLCRRGLKHFLLLKLQIWRWSQKSGCLDCSQCMIKWVTCLYHPSLFHLPTKWSNKLYKVPALSAGIYWTVFFFWRNSPPVGHGLLIHEVSRSHTTTHHIRSDSSGRVISSSQRSLPDNTQRSQETDIRAPGGIRTHNLSRRAVADLSLRPHSHWDRHIGLYGLIKFRN